MNVKELINFAVEKSKKKGGDVVVTQKQARHCIAALVSAVGDTLADGGAISIAGLGVWSKRRRKASVRRNPKTNAVVTVPAHRVAYFKASKTLNKRM